MSAKLIGRVVLRDGRSGSPARDKDGNVILFDLDSDPREWSGFGMLDMPVAVTAERFREMGGKRG